MINEFVRRNYQQAYDSFLWPESIIMVNVTNYLGIICPYYIDKVLGVRSPGKFRMTPADAGLVLDVSPSMFEELGDPIAYIVVTPVAVSTLPPSTTALTLSSTSPQDFSNVIIRGEVIAGGQEPVEQITLNGTGAVTTRFAYDVPITIAKDQTIGDVTINAAVDGSYLGTIPWFLRERKYQRLWLLPIIDPAKTDRISNTCLVLGKRLINTLLSDQDTPLITGIQQVLIAAAAADLYLHLQKPDLVTVFQQKADGALKNLIAKNTDQAASSPRFVPEIEPLAYYHNNAEVWAK
jgi:hypothetical protein